MLRVGNVGNLLDEMVNKNEDNIDLILIDIDHKNIIENFERSMKLVRNGGIIAIDSSLWHGYFNLTLTFLNYLDLI